MADQGESEATWRGNRHEPPTSRRAWNGVLTPAQLERGILYAGDDPSADT